MDYRSARDGKMLAWVDSYPSGSDHSVKFGAE